MKLVKDILTKQPSHFNSVDVNDKVIDAIALMTREDLNYVIVTEKGKYVGILSERDYTRKVILAGKESKKAKVSEIMSADIPVVNIADTTDTCRELMHAFKISFLPVFDEFDFAGVITLSDLLKEAVDEQMKLANEKKTFGKDRGNDIFPRNSL
jgi:predicted transcriptional regulator